MSKVLIIESDAAVARELSDALAARGITSRVTADGTEGLALARSESPELIILCVELSRVSGYSICNKLKKDPELGQIPLILTSSQATEETFEQHKKLKTRAEAYLKKPYSQDEIMALVEQYVSGGATSDVEVSIDDEVSVEFDEEAFERPAPASKPARAAPAAMGTDFGGGGDTVVMSAADLQRARAEADSQASAKAARPAARPSAAAAPAARALDTSELRALRQKVQQLEQQLEQKEIEFNDRLLQESARAREAVDVKKKLAAVEREIGKYQQLAERAKQEAQEARTALERAREEQRAIESERQTLSDKIGQLVDKLKEVVADRDRLQAEVERLEEELSGARAELEAQVKMREKAKKAVDIAMQLIDETGLAN